MSHQTVFDLPGANSVASRFEHVIRAASIPKVAIRITTRQITGATPITRVFFLGRLGVIPVAKKKHRVILAVMTLPQHRYFTNNLIAAALACIVDHIDHMARVAFTHAARLGRPPHIGSLVIHGAITDDVVDLRLPKHLVHNHAQLPLAPLKDGVTHRLPCTHERMELKVKLGFGSGIGLHHRLQCRREQKAVGDPVAL